MRLFFDENLSLRLTQNLATDYPDSLHVRDVGLSGSDDILVWEYAKPRKLTIASKDSDFHQRSFLFGAPPKVIWRRIQHLSAPTILILLFIARLPIIILINIVFFIIPPFESMLSHI